MEAHDWTMADLEAALRQTRTYLAALEAAIAKIYVKDQEVQHLREQYARLEGAHNALLEKARSAPPALGEERHP